MSGEGTGRTGLERPAGSFEQIEHRGDRLLLSGWMLLPDSGPLDEIHVLWNGEARGTAGRVPRPDLSAAMPWIERAEDGGFSIALELGGEPRGRAELIGYLGDRPAARQTVLAGPPSPDAPPLPPLELIQRVSAAPAMFDVMGIRAFTDFIDQVDSHAKREEIANVLDWGCGCGRYTRSLIDADLGQVHGCDIDAEAIAWCRQELGAGRFTAIETEPPTPYEDGSMDLIIGCSVFTHLTRADQAKWLAELHRISAPGGLVLASVHGDFGFRFAHGGPPPAGIRGVRERLRRRGRAMGRKRSGILDSEGDPALDGVAPSGYYRGTYQTRDYTIREFSKQFEILDYIERGLCGAQDLVVMRR